MERVAKRKRVESSLGTGTDLKASDDDDAAKREAGRVRATVREQNSRLRKMMMPITRRKDDEICVLGMGHNDLD
ncbi:MAG: hypothetical protein M1816_001459 [Peltula sp. TS41687]|nr:MAG: hypothetical protein M1816_001459 [Peltula sp. TS41687]